ncbi:MAG TPA: GNAT family N-acetyltransferase [Terriglobales bacterium]|nr:GNAT family N-acetyltransferase [Terriglobales bacterium]
MAAILLDPAQSETLGLEDGGIVRMRLIRPDDEPRLVDLYEHLSQHTVYQRFFTLMPRLPADWARALANVDYTARFAVVIEREGRAGVELIGVARYEPTGEPGLVEVAFVVRDEFQGKGYGRRLLDALLAAAEAKGITRFRAWVLADNRRMLRLLNEHTRVVSRSLDSGVAELVFERRA